MEINLEWGMTPKVAKVIVNSQTDLGDKSKEHLLNILTAHLQPTPNEIVTANLKHLDPLSKLIAESFVGDDSIEEGIINLEYNIAQLQAVIKALKTESI